MRILYLATARIPGERAGALQIARTCSALVESGAEVHLVTRRVPQGADLFAFYGLKTRFRVHRLPTFESSRLFSLSYRFWLMLTLFRLRLSVGPLGILYTREPGLVAMLDPFQGVLGARIFLEIRELTGDELKPGTPAFGMLTRAFARAIGVSVGTRRLRSDLTALYALEEAKVAAIPNGCDADMPAPLPEREGRPSCIVYTGQMYDWKGADLLVEAFARLDPALGLRLVMVGGIPEDLDRLKALASRLGVQDRVEFTGFLPPLEAAARQREADLLAIPTLDTESGRYALTVKVFEYMVAGRPIVATRIPPNEEVLTDGETGILADPTPEAFAAGLARAARDPALLVRMARRAREVALGEYSWKRRGEKTLAFLRVRIAA